MTALVAPSAPAAGARYRKHSTGRTWHVDRVTGSGLISLTEEYYGIDCDVREYVTTDELGRDFDAAT
ncbi:hypothetical protein [Paenarthrobacter sp. YJN-5]|uniref:hypothetical protein n=1 Tax=Paenarthrobacter sp. YJN-5 TaxID=2735316 RepID=UPI001878B3FE|nr:hypothetical protein [Paenarthrobacter sp. YJN-5]QOT19251.1 hypothetical protein HMI59_21305 [Paenarthrobacter sp. YJN-5]